MTAPTTDGRLICVCSCTYEITADGTLAPSPQDIYYAGAGFVQAPTTLVRGNDHIDACLVGRTSDGLVLAFRGTLPFNPNDPLDVPTLLDWLSDFNAVPEAVSALPGQVHSGFATDLSDLWDPIQSALKTQGVSPGETVLITGQSKGGAVVPLAAWRIRHELGIKTRALTFAAAKAGNSIFAAAYDIMMDHTRYEYADDIVPHLPPSQEGFMKVLAAVPGLGPVYGDVARFDYQPVGKLQFIDWSGQIEGDSPSLRAQRALRLAGILVRGEYKVLVDDHHIDCGFGYMKAVCPTGLCPP